MSLFNTLQVPCPACSVPVSFDLVHSVNADRRPDLREQIMQRSFQQQACPSCSEAFRIEPQFTYLHTEGGVWIAAWPASKLDVWAECEARSCRAFAASYGEQGSPAAQVIGRELRARVCFGWEAVREKLLVLEAGIDDVALELAKIALLRNVGDLGASDDREMRLLAIDEQQRLAFAILNTGSETLIETLAVPRALLDEIDADGAGWQALRESLAQGPFVDMARLVLGAPPVAREA